MADSVGIGFPSSNIQKGHIFHDLDEGSTWVFLDGPPRLASSWRLLNGIFSNDPDTTLWGAAQAGATWYNLSLQAVRIWDGTQAATIKIAGVPVNFFDYKTMTQFQDDFVAAVTTPYFTRSGGTQTGAIYSQNNPGAVRINTSAVSGTLVGFFLSNGSELFAITGTYKLTWIARLVTNDANTQVRLGALVSGGTTNPPSNGKYFEKLDADVNWFLVTRGGGVETRVDSGIVIDTNYHTFTIEVDADNTTRFYVDGTLLLTTTTNTVTGNIRAAVSIINSAAADKNIDIDYLSLTVLNITRI